MRIKVVRITTVPMSFRLLLTNQLAFLQYNGFEVYAVSGKDPHHNDLQVDGIPLIHIPFTRRISPFTDLICLIKLVRVLKSIEPHIVHSHTPKAGLLGMMAAWLCQVPFRLHTVAGLPWTEKKGLMRWILMFAEYLTYKFSTHVYPNSFGLLEFLAKEFPSSLNKFKVIGNGSSNGIDVTYFTPSTELFNAARSIRARYSIPDDGLVIGFLGRLVRDKGISELLAAYKQLRKKYNHLRLMLVGDEEPERDPLKEADIAFIRSAGDIIMPGFQEDVRAWILTMDIFVFPSYREGFPNALLQAACMQRACVATDINGNNEIIKQNISGILVPVKDVTGLVEAVEILIENKCRREIYGQRAREFAIQHFSREFVWQKWLDEYNSMKQIIENRVR